MKTDRYTFCQLIYFVSDQKFLQKQDYYFLLWTVLQGVPWQPSGQDSGLSLRWPGFSPWSGHWDPTSHSAKKKTVVQMKERLKKTLFTEFVFQKVSRILTNSRRKKWKSCKLDHIDDYGTHLSSLGINYMKKIMHCSQRSCCCKIYLHSLYHISLTVRNKIQISTTFQI